MQRRDAARELKTLREEMTQEVLKTQIEKERAHEHLALILVLPLPLHYSSYTLPCTL